MLGLGKGRVGLLAFVCVLRLIVPVPRARLDGIFFSRKRIHWGFQLNGERLCIFFPLLFSVVYTAPSRFWQCLFVSPSLYEELSKNFWWSVRLHAPLQMLLTFPGAPLFLPPVSLPRR